MTISQEPRINSEIRVGEVRLVNQNGDQMGVVAIKEALRLAEEANLDLVEVAPTAKPPVCRIIDYGKYRYQQAKRAKEVKKKQKIMETKEIKIRPKIDPHDYTIKLNHIEEFLLEGHKVKITLMYRGREMSHKDIGDALMQKVIEETDKLAVVEFGPRQEGRSTIIILRPKVSKHGEENA